MLSHIFWMLLAVEKDISSELSRISLLGSYGIMSETDLLANLIKQAFGRLIHFFIDFIFLFVYSIGY